MDHELDRVIEVAASLDPINAAFYLMMQLPYLQPFMNVNKRTSRVAINSYLLRAGLAPFSFVGVERNRYHGGVVAYVDLGHEQLLKEAFIQAYSMNTLTDRLVGDAVRYKVSRERVEIALQLLDYVLEGKAPLNTVLRSVIDRLPDDSPIG